MQGGTVPEPIREIFKYHYWATFTIIDHLATLPPEHLNDSVPGTAGSIIDTLKHLINADNLYQVLVQDQPRPPRDEQTNTLQGLRDKFEAQSTKWEEILDHVDDYDPTLHNEEGDFPHARDLLITQAIHHGNDHRTHICTILGATGQEVPEIDEWTYWFSDQH